MTYSVPRAGGGYDYYESSSPPIVRIPRSFNGVGLAITQALPHLPIDARRTGTGPIARGIVVLDSVQRRVAESRGLLAIGAVVIGGIIAFLFGRRP